MPGLFDTGGKRDFMGSFIEYLSNHPIIIIVLAAVMLLMIYFICVKFFKMVLITGLVLLALGGYLYYRSPTEFPDTVQKTLKDVKQKSGEVVEKGKELLEKNKDLTKGLGNIVEEGKKAILGE